MTLSSLSAGYSWITTADIALAFSVVNGAWSLWGWITDRPRFRVEVYWDWNDSDVPPVPSIAITNTGKKAGYVENIQARAGKNDRQWIALELRQKVEPEETFTHRPDWSEGAEMPSFSTPWKTLTIAVEDGTGRWCVSKPAKEKPSWYYCRYQDV